ncbi:MAG: sulfatase [Gemmatimonadota bacterium]
MTTRLLHSRDTLWLAVAGALASGAMHVALVMVRLHALGRFSNSARELPWFSPVIYLSCFLLVGLAVVVVARVWRAAGSPLVQGGVFGGLAALSALLNATSLHPLAQLVLAVGVGSLCGRWLAGAPERRLPLLRKVAIGLALALFVSGIPDIVVYRLRQPLRLAALPPAPPDAPNVILPILDTVRAENLSVYGYERPTTPNLEQLALEGTTFDAAISTAPWTAPSHSSMLTGRYPTHNGNTYLSPMADSMPTVTEVFRDHGYATGAFMGNAGYGGHEMGFDRAFIRYDDYPASLAQAMWSTTFTQLDVSQGLIDAVRNRSLWRVRRALTRSSFRIIGLKRADKNPANTIVDNFFGWRDQVGARPYFAMLNFIDAHEPYLSPNQDRYNAGKRDIDRYDGAIAFEDSIIGSLVARLRERGELERTVFVVTADHGEQLGEHGLTRHGNSLYLELLHVPLLMRAPGRVPAGLRIPAVVSLRDIPSTLLDLAALPQGRITGTSLAAAWAAPGGAAVSSLSPAIAETERPINMTNDWPTSYGPMKSVVRGSFQYVHRGDGVEQVFAWQGDTAGRGDLSTTAVGDLARQESRSILASLLGSEWRQRATRAVPR